MPNQVAVIFTNLDGSAPLKCRKTDVSTVERIQLDADERALAVHVLAPSPFKDVINGHDITSLSWNPAAMRLAVKTTDVSPPKAAVHTWAFPTSGPIVKKLNKPLPDAPLAAYDVQFPTYDGNNYNTLETQAVNWQSENDTLCEVV
jgi:hypothetical protein